MSRGREGVEQGGHLTTFRVFSKLFSFFFQSQLASLKRRRDSTMVSLPTHLDIRKDYITMMSSDWRGDRAYHSGGR